jgi:hypothetical protein
MHKKLILHPPKKAVCRYWIRHLDTAEIAITAPASTVMVSVELDTSISLLPNLVGWWKFDNNLNDESSNGITLSLLGGGSASYVSGDIDNAIDIASDTIPSATNAALDSLHSSGFQFAIVFNPDSYNSSFSALLAHNDNGNASHRKFSLRFDDIPPTRMLLVASNASGGFAALCAINGLPSTGSYHLIEGYFDPTIGTHGQIGIALDNGTFDTANLSTAMSTISTTTVPLTIGNEINTGGAQTDDLQLGRDVDGKIEMVAIWDTVFSDLTPTGPERAALWNSGNFRTNP